MWKTKIIELYCTVCQCTNNSRYQEKMQRLSNNFRPKFTDEEIITVMIWGIAKRRFETKTIYNYTKDHLLDWFPELPSYQAFNRRATELTEIFRMISEDCAEKLQTRANENILCAMDSCPIIVAKANRSSNARTARTICDKSYNSSRKEWYYGVKLHSINRLETGSIPKPISIMITSASSFDLTVSKQLFRDCLPFTKGKLIADKAYCDKTWRDELMKNDIELITPRKLLKGETPLPGGDWLNTAISSIRQPIESFFQWINFKTNIQVASKVRSLAGLFLHIFSKIAAALFSIILDF